ncbi:uncharacterized protein LOC135688403 [Rhopilema esculentum]|uniref:uncharacterized protein LOC135688403 n=1 Tax=Rhopilema esculentum TaxID=499914 RepID=UPI0031D80FA5
MFAFSLNVFLKYYSFKSDFKSVPKFEEVDDTNFISKDPRIIDDIETKAAQVLGRFDLVVNAQKTERHKIDKERNDQIKILGSFTDIMKEMKNRKQMAQAAFSHHHHVLTNEKLAASTRIRAFNVYVKPVLLYNCQTWDLGEADRDALDACHRRLLRRVLRVFYPAKLPNDEVYRRAGVEKVSTEVDRQRWAFVGHTLRHGGPARAAMEMYEETAKGKKRRRGQPAHNIAQTVSKDMAQKNCTAKDAQDRALWRQAKKEEPRRSSRSRKGQRQKDPNFMY